MRIEVASYSEAKKILGIFIQCIGKRNGYLAYENPRDSASPTIIVVGENRYKKRQK